MCIYIYIYIRERERENETGRIPIPHTHTTNKKSVDVLYDMGWMDRLGNVPMHISKNRFPDLSRNQTFGKIETAWCAANHLCARNIAQVRSEPLTCAQKNTAHACVRTTCALENAAQVHSEPLVRSKTLHRLTEKSVINPKSSS